MSTDQRLLLIGSTAAFALLAWAAMRWDFLRGDQQILPPVKSKPQSAVDAAREVEARRMEIESFVQRESQ